MLISAPRMRAHRLLVEAEEIGAAEQDAAAAALEGWRLDAEDRQSDQRLAAAGLAHHGGHHAGLQPIGDAMQHRQ